MVAPSRWPACGARGPVALGGPGERLRRREGGALAVRLRCMQGELDDERSAGARLALDADGAAVGGDDPPDDVEAESEAAEVADGDGALEALEDPRLIGLGDAHAVIADDEQRAVAQAAHDDVNGGPGAVLERVGQEVDEDLLH